MDYRLFIVALVSVFPCAGDFSARTIRVAHLATGINNRRENEDIGVVDTSGVFVQGAFDGLTMFQYPAFYYGRMY